MQARRFGVTYNKAKREEEEAMAAFSKAVIVWSMVLELSPFCCESMPSLLNVWAWHLRGEPSRTPQKKHPRNNKRGILVKEDKERFKRLTLFFYLRSLVKLLYGTVSTFALIRACCDFL